MKKDKIIYWVATGLIAVVMIFSMYKMYTPDYDRLHLPNYLRIELSVFKILGLLVLLLPQFSIKIKEWAYAGFGIVLISASVAHFASGDALIRSLEPMIFLIALIISNICLHNLNRQIS
jgi:hypothetical protein